MCLYPTYMRNKKYTANKTNGGNVPPVNDKRTLWIPVGCQKCIECVKQKANGWRVRLLEEVRKGNNAKFVTLTLSNESYKELHNEVKAEQNIIGYELDNAIISLAVRRFTELWRYHKGNAPKHWLITELGHNGTENIHIHGLIWAEDREDITKIWKYGHVWIGKYVSQKTINYMIKYVSKMDADHPNYKPKIYSSKGIGKGYTDREDAKLNKYKAGGKTREEYRTSTGIKLALPIYYRNKIYTEEEREKLWIEKLNKGERYVLGQRTTLDDGGTHYYNLLESARKKNAKLGYGNNEKDWNKIEYENTRREIMTNKRLGKEEGEN